MNSVHDLGGLHGFGPVDRSQQENFASHWEERVFALTLACGFLGRWNLDQSRFARERMAPAHYLASGYYEHWLHGLETLLQEQGLVSAAELASGVADGPAEGVQALTADTVSEILSRGGPTELASAQPPAFVVGDEVRVIRGNPRSHTRAPRYCRGCCGTVIAHHGAHVFPDRNAAEGVREPQHLYGVRFEAAALWGEADAEPASPVCIDLFEAYLESA